MVDIDTDRIARLRQAMLQGHHGRHRIFMPTNWDVRGLDCSLVERKAHALAMLLDRMPVFIEPDELIVGGRTVMGRRGPGLEGLERPRDPSKDSLEYCCPRYARDEELDRLGRGEGGSQGHYVPNYPKVMRLGFGGIIAQAADRLARETVPSRCDFLKAVIVIFQGAAGLANRYAALADEQALDASPERAAELHEIASACRHVATQPPATFHQACQLAFFLHLVTVIENYSLLSQGRMDQYLLPSYAACEGARAALLLRCLLIKLNDIGDLKLGDVSYDGMDNVIVGGLLPDGRDGVNDLTYAILDAAGELKLPNPQIAARVHRGSPPRYIHRLAELSTGHFGQLAFYNDDAFVPALESVGYCPADARDYVLDACQDVLIDGKSSFFVLAAVTLTGIFQQTLAEADDAWSFEQLLERFKRRIAENISDCVRQYNARENVDGRETISPLPFLSGTMDDCIEKGLDITQGGLRFNDKGMMVSAPVTAINSLVAVRAVVFDRKEATLSQLKAALAADWKGCEALRQKCLAAPKWGNDDDRVDLLGKEIVEFACREILTHRTGCGARVLSGVHQPHPWAAGTCYTATPDGRRSGEGIPVTLSPANGSDRSGPTAVMKSVAKIDPMLSQWNNALLMSFHPTAVRGREGLAKFTHLLEAFFAMGGMQLQLNVVSAETLRQAQREPQKHPDLVVRVWGMSARFVELCKGYQDDVIARTQHQL
ncbi:MAG: hypothetical protein LLG01_02865 [Planctomycetaceae bacterium]|nr:hypothetical protein [Planctomycetaceae bacterium]